MVGRHAGQAPEIDGSVYLSGGPVLPGELRARDRHPGHRLRPGRRGDRRAAARIAKRTELPAGPPFE